MRKRIVYFVLSFLFLCLIVSASSVTPSETSSAGGTIINFINKVFFLGNLSQASKIGITNFISKGICHFLLFFFNGLFSMLFVLTFEEKTRNFALLMFYGFFISVLGEALQFFTAGRNPTGRDAIINLSGFLFPIILNRLLKKRVF